LFCKKLRAAGLTKLDSEGPLAFSVRACQSLPHQQEEIQQITSLYIQQKYADEQNKFEQFKRAVINFKLTKTKK
jgi:hypothetical protein